MRGRQQNGLILFKRHQDTNCAVYKGRVPSEPRRFRWHCQCPFWIYGTLPSGTAMPRQTTGTSDPKQAEALRQSLLLRVPADEVSGLPVAECIQKYLDSREHDLDGRTLSQHKRSLESLQQFLQTKGVLYIQQMTVDHLETFKTEGPPKAMASTSRATVDAKIRCFLRAAFRRDWIPQALVLKVTTVKAVYEQKEPYTDEEVTDILKESLNLFGGRQGYAAHPKTFRLLLELMLTTGLRVGDAVSFDPRRLSRGDNLWIYARSEEH